MKTAGRLSQDSAQSPLSLSLVNIFWLQEWGASFIICRLHCCLFENLSDERFKNLSCSCLVTTCTQKPRIIQPSFLLFIDLSLRHDGCDTVLHLPHRFPPSPPQLFPPTSSGCATDGTNLSFLTRQSKHLHSDGFGFRGFSRHAHTHTLRCSRS